VEAIADGVDISLGELLDASSAVGFPLMDLQRIPEHQGRNRGGRGRRQNRGIVRKEIAIFEDRQAAAVIDMSVRQKDRIHRLRGKTAEVGEFLAASLVESTIDEKYKNDVATEPVGKTSILPEDLLNKVYSRF